MMTTTALLPSSAPLGHHHHHPTPVSTSTSPASSSPPPPAATSTSSSPTPPVSMTHPALLQLPFRPDLLLPPNGSLSPVSTGVKKLGGAAAAAPPSFFTPVLTTGTAAKKQLGAAAVPPALSSSSKPVYATPSPVENTPQNNECKLVEVKGAKLASFTVRDTELLCLPQAFDLFLKHLVGGLHTVYTKLKRLDITPVVCNVEQVRVLRGLGAIQPGVNRCKLISRQDFEALYSDCTNASSRPGRPPKRLQSVTSSECATHHMLSHSGLMPAGILPAAGCMFPLRSPEHRRLKNDFGHQNMLKLLPGLSALAKKIKLEVMGGYHSNQQHGLPNGENGDHNPGLGLEQLPFMMMSHPLIPASLNPASVSMAMGQMSRLSTLASMANVAQLHHHAHNHARAPTSVIKERVRDSPSPSPSLEEGQMSSNHSSSVSSSPSHTERTAESTHPHHDNMSSSHGVLGHSPSTVQGVMETDVAPLEYSKDNKRSHTDRDNCSLAPTQTTRDGCDRPGYQGQKLAAGREGCERVTYPRGQKLPAGLHHHHHAPFIFPEGLSSIETLLTNIQGLLRVAIENARAQEKQDQLERTELKMELVRERELRESLERQLSVEQKNRVLIQKRLKKEKRSKRRLQEALEEEVKLRDQAEHSLLHTADTPTDSMTQEVDGSNHDDIMPDIKPTIQEGRVFLQTTGMY